MSQRTGARYWYRYGGIVSATNETHVRLWAPNPDPRQSYFPTPNEGCVPCL
jgi:hypothetical protein